MIPHVLIVGDDPLADLDHQRLDVVLALLVLLRAVEAGLHLCGPGGVLAEKVVQEALHGLTELRGIHATLAVAGKAL